MEFIKSNPHPKGKKIGDCVIRALAIADNKNWIDVYKDLIGVGLKIYDMPNSKPVYEYYLETQGWKKQPMPRHPSGKRMKLSEFIDQNPDIEFVANVIKHMATVKYGKLFDTWNCGHKCIGNYFLKL